MMPMVRMMVSLVWTELGSGPVQNDGLDGWEGSDDALPKPTGNGCVKTECPSTGGGMC